MKTADLLFLIAAVLLALTEAKDNGGLVESGIAEGSITTLILRSLLHEIQQIRASLDQQIQNVDLDRRVLFQLALSQCTMLPLLDLPHHNTTYFLCQTKLNWHMAQKSCKNLGMNLAVIDNDIIFSSVVRHLNDFAGQLGIPNIGFWIAGTDLGNEGNWYWQSNGQLFTWQKWQPEQPDNKHANEHCLELIKWPTEHSHGFGFNDLICTDRVRFICEFN